MTPNNRTLITSRVIKTASRWDRFVKIWREKVKSYERDRKKSNSACWLMNFHGNIFLDKLDSFHSVSCLLVIHVWHFQVLVLYREGFNHPWHIIIRWHRSMTQDWRQYFKNQLIFRSQPFGDFKSFAHGK